MSNDPATSNPSLPATSQSSGTSQPYLVTEDGQLVQNPSLGSKSHPTGIYKSQAFPPAHQGTSTQSDSSAGTAMTAPSHEEMDAKIAAAEARNDTKIARIEGKFDTLSATITARFDTLSSDIAKSRQETSDSRLLLMVTTIASALAIGALILGMATYGDALFGRGMDVHKVIEDTIHSLPPNTPSAKP